MRLGLNFVGFITRWSNLGCPSPGLLDSFYNPDQNRLMNSGEHVEDWRRWLS